MRQRAEDRSGAAEQTREHIHEHPTSQAPVTIAGAKRQVPHGAVLHVSQASQCDERGASIIADQLTRPSRSDVDHEDSLSSTKQMKDAFDCGSAPQCNHAPPSRSMYQLAVLSSPSRTSSPAARHQRHHCRHQPSFDDEQEEVWCSKSAGVSIITTPPRPAPSKEGKEEKVGRKLATSRQQAVSP